MQIDTLRAKYDHDDLETGFADIRKHIDNNWRNEWASCAGVLACNTVTTSFGSAPATGVLISVLQKSTDKQYG